MRDFTINTSRDEDGLIDVSVDVTFKNNFSEIDHPLKKSELNIASQLIAGVEFEDRNGMFSSHRVMSFTRNVGGSKLHYPVEFEEAIDWSVDSEEIKRIINGRIRTINRCIENKEYTEICRIRHCNCDIVSKTKYEEDDMHNIYIVKCSEGHEYKVYERKS